MTFSVGILYSAHQLLQLVSDVDFSYSDFDHYGGRIGLIDAQTVLSTCLKCEWIDVDLKGRLRTTRRGVDILISDTPCHRLQLQIIDLLKSERPPWAKKLKYGRDETFVALPPDARQCFEEAGLADEWSDELILLWRDVTKMAWVASSQITDDIGMQAEWWTIQFEAHRTGVAPKWVSLDSSYSGFDVLSVRGPGSGNRMRIEVKGTVQKGSNAQFHVSANEWSTACKGLSDYYFDLWSIDEPPSLFRVEATAVLPHIAGNKGNGRWSTLQVPFKPFQTAMVDLSKVPMDIFDFRFFSKGI